jgi:geranylgeranyl pyrophosphate synthase
VADVKAAILRELTSLQTALGGRMEVQQLKPGKMLRTRLASRLSGPRQEQVSWSVLVRACAATELTHTASLCHDDLIDNAVLRRFCPTLWRSSGPSAAVLVGDLLFCSGMAMLSGVGDGGLLARFVAKMQETCLAETEQELCLRGRVPDLATCLRIARGKTGPMFAFPSSVCGGCDADLTAALEQAGYDIGTAYQLADDLLDAAGAEESAGKTLGTDRARDKSTVAEAASGGASVAAFHIRRLLDEAGRVLAPWPEVRHGLSEFVRWDLAPTLRTELAFDEDLVEMAAAAV